MKAGMLAAGSLTGDARLIEGHEMKCSVEFDCTPEEARRFLGLPDVQPLQAKIFAEVERKMLAEMERFSPDAMLKTWLSLYTQAPEPFQDMFGAMMRKAAGKPTP